MEIIFVIVSIGYLAIIVFLAITWYKDVARKEDTDKRILVLEKRITDYRRDMNDTILRYVQDLYQAKNINDSCILQLGKKVGKLEKRLPKNNK